MSSPSASFDQYSNASLPLELRNELSLLDRRLRWVSFAKGFGSVLFFSLLLAALFLATDYWMPLPGSIRFAFLCAFGITLFLLSIRWILVPLSRRRRWPELAYLIDCSHPDLQERVSSTVELALTPHTAGIESNFMRDRLRQETNTRLNTIDLWDCLSLKTTFLALCGATLLTLVTASPFLLNGQGYTLLWQRLLTPWANLDSATNLTFLVENGDRTVPRGDDVLITAEPQWRYHEGTLPREIRLRWTDAQGTTQTREMSYDSGRNAYIGKIPEVSSNISFVLSAPGARSREYLITVADRPRILDVQLEVIPPAYTGLPATVIEGAIGTMRVVEGSQLKAKLAFEYPVASADWVWQTPRLVNQPADENTPPAAVPELQPLREAATISADHLLAEISTIATQTDHFQFEVVNTAGLGNIDEPSRIIQIIPDRAPRIEIAGNQDPVKVNVSDVIPIEISADDDFGLADVRILIEHLSSGAVSSVLIDWPSPQAGPEVRQLSDSYELNLASLNLKPGDIIGYRAVARDTRPHPAPNETWTTRRVLMLDSEVKTIAGQEVEEFYDSVRRHADIVKNEIAAHRKDLESNRRELDPQPREKAKEKIEEKRPDWMQTKLALSLQLDDLQRRLESRPITQALSRMQAKPAQELIDETARQLQQFEPQPDNTSIELIRKQEEDVRSAEKMLEQLLNQLRDAERIEQELTELQSLARRARELSQDANSLAENQNQPQQEMEQDPAQADNPEQALERKPIEELRDEWSALNNDLNQLLQRRPELKQAAKNALLTDLAEVAELADELATEQNELTEALDQTRQQMQADQQPLQQELNEANQLARQLAEQAEQESRVQATPAFDAAPTQRAMEEQAEANLNQAGQFLEQAQENLKQFQQELTEAQPLSADTTEAAKQLAERLQKLAPQLQANQDEFSKLKKEADELAKKQDELGKQIKQNGESEQTQAKQEEIEQKRNEIQQAQQQQQQNQRKLAEQLAGLSSAVESLPTPPQVQGQKRNAMQQLDQARDELAQQTDRADDRVNDAAREMQNLANALGNPQQRANNAQHPLKQLADQAQQLAEQLQQKAEKNEPADEGLQQQQFGQVREAVGLDSVEREKELADAVKAGLEAQQQLKDGKLQAAADKQKDFAGKLRELADEVTAQAQADPNAQPEQAPQNPQEQPASRAEQAKAWDELPLTPELQERKNPSLGTTPQQMKEALQKIAAEQQKHQQAVQDAIAKNQTSTNPEDLKRDLRNLAGQQHNLLEQMKGLNSPEAALPRLNAQQQQRIAEEALQKGDAQTATTAQEEAAAQLEEALAQLEPNQPAPDKSAQQLAEKLAEKLANMKQQLAQAQPAAPQTPENPDATPASEGTPPQMTPEQLAEALQGLQQTQERIADQSEQLAEQAALIDPSQQERNESLKQAAESARKASRQLNSGQLPASQQQAQQAQQAFEKGSESAQDDDPTAPIAETLADQQQQVAEQIQDLMQNPLAGPLAREQKQSELQATTESLAEAFQNLAEKSEMKPIDERRNGEQLTQMQQQSQEAAQSMQQSSQQSQAGNLQASQQSSQQAANLLQALADQSAQLANTKRDTLVPEQVGEEAADASRMLQDAQQSLDQAMAEQQQQQSASQTPPQDGSPAESSQQSPNSSENANPSGNPSQNPASQDPSALQQLAQQLAQVAQALNQAHENLQPQQDNQQSQQSEQSMTEGNPSQPSPDADSQQGNQTPLSGDEKLDPNAVRSALMRDWGKRYGTLDAELSDSQKRTIDRQYAPLIKSYLEAVADPDAATRKP